MTSWSSQFQSLLVSVVAIHFCCPLLKIAFLSTRKLSTRDVATDKIFVPMIMIM